MSTATPGSTGTTGNPLPPPGSPERPWAPVFSNVLELIGNTPMLEVQNLDTGPCRLFLKLEAWNPGQSIKDRIAVSMIEAAEQDGRLKPGGTLIEGTAGNTGIALALVALQKGYRVIVVVPDKMSEGKISHLRAMGAEVRLTRSDVAKGHPEYYQDLARGIAESTPNSLFVNQFGNPANPAAHEATTGPEIWHQLDGKVDAFCTGVGSGGTITGVGHYLRRMNPDVDLVLADPLGSILTPLINEGRHVEPGSWLVEGIGEDFVPDILDLDQITVGYEVTDQEAFETARELLKAEGILAGSSSGTLIAAALRYCRDQTEPKNVVTFVCDSGAKYLDKMFNDFWMIDQGFIEREQFGDLRDLIARRHQAREDFVLQPGTSVMQAVKQMRLYDVSQMVVVDEQDGVIGIIDESDVLLGVAHDQSNFQRPVSDFMTRRIETVPPTASVNDLMPIFRADRVAVVADADRYYGLITRIDLLNYLRNQLT
jgi:cystathionine beta-synthase